MGLSILDLVLRKLRTAGFQADVAFPGQKYPLITEPVAAVHIEKVDRSNLNVTVEVSIISPASLGGTQCEVEALRATEVLRWAGATCIQNGCSYDGLAQVYVVSILATFTCITGADACTLGPGFCVTLAQVQLPYVLSFQAEQSQALTAQYAIGEDGPIGISSGSWVWSVQLEELVPMGSGEIEDPDGPFTLRVESDTAIEEFSNCYWTKIHREYTRQGLRQIRSGIGLERSVYYRGENEL